MRLGVEAAVVDGVLVRGDVSVADGRVEALGLSGGGRGIAVPGFVDLHVHGFGGVDFAAADAEAWRHAAAALVAAGTTAVQPTFVTAPEEDLLASLRAVPLEDVGLRLLGCHLEGPFLSPGRLGMHPAAARRDPDLALLERLLAAGPVTEVTLAPELPGALELVDALVARGIAVSCGHSDATATEAAAAFDRGACSVTHLFNAMRPFGHRDPGLAGAALARDGVVCELILDGHHLAPEAALVAWSAARGRIALVTDAVEAAGVGDGRFRLGATPIVVRDGVARREDGTLAGSVLSPAQAVRNAVGLGIPLAEAVDAATRVPARVLRRDDVGSIAPGRPADVVVLDDRLEVVRVLLGGGERL
ncbi:MAG TPA: N-acetylglucosamine-6-phosphate deacetylase [Gaiellaceae bacterium]|nr:N-acetylglucosamine-6-phosphate deacetylase [Gaiellaceae bacterium]